MDGRSRRILPVVPSSSSNPRLCPHAPPLLPALAIPLLRPLAPILPEQAPCGAAASAADEPGAATSTPMNMMEAAVWLEDEDGARATQEQAGSLRRMPSWRAELARDASCRSCPIQRLCFYYRRGPVSCQRMTHVSCFKDFLFLT